MYATSCLCEKLSDFAVSKGVIQLNDKVSYTPEVSGELKPL
jgi:hypothetical protein